MVHGMPLNHFGNHMVGTKNGFNRLTQAIQLAFFIYIKNTYEFNHKRFFLTICHENHQVSHYAPYSLQGHVSERYCYLGTLLC